VPWDGDGALEEQRRKSQKRRWEGDRAGFFHHIFLLRKGGMVIAS